MASNNKEFQVYMEIFDSGSVSTKVRSLMWNCWEEATRIAESKITSHNSQRLEIRSCLELFARGESEGSHDTYRRAIKRLCELSAV